MKYAIFKSSAVPLTFRVFMNFPQWLGMKVYELIVEDFNVKAKLLAECKAQHENQQVSKLYAEVTSIGYSQWKRFDDKGAALECLKCQTKECIQCKYYNVFVEIIKYE